MRIDSHSPFFDNVSKLELDKFRAFIDDHPQHEAIVQGQKIAYLDSREGDKTLLLFHGLAGTADFVFHSVEAYKDRFRVIAFNIDGFHTNSDFSDAVNAVLEKEGIDRVNVLGGSFGGIVAQGYFALNSKRVEHLILVDTLFPDKAHNKGLSRWFLRWMMKR